MSSFRQWRAAAATRVPTGRFGAIFLVLWNRRLATRLVPRHVVCVRRSICWRKPQCQGSVEKQRNGQTFIRRCLSCSGRQPVVGSECSSGNPDGRKRKWQKRFEVMLDGWMDGTHDERLGRSSVLCFLTLPPLLSCTADCDGAGTGGTA